MGTIINMNEERILNHKTFAGTRDAIPLINRIVPSLRSLIDTREDRLISRILILYDGLYSSD